MPARPSEESFFSFVDRLPTQVGSKPRAVAFCTGLKASSPREWGEIARNQRDRPPGAHHALPWCTPYPTPGAHHALPHGWRKRVSALANAVFLGLVFRAGRCCSFGGSVHSCTLRREISARSARENQRQAEKIRRGCGVPQDRRMGQEARMEESASSPENGCAGEGVPKLRNEGAKADLPIGNGRVVGLGAGRRAPCQSWEEKRRPVDSRKRSYSGRWRRRCRSSSFDCPRSFRKSFSRRAVMALS